VIAEPSLEEACKDATLCIFCLPHQFLPSILPTIENTISKNNAHAISLIKGVDFTKDGLQLISETISQGLGGVPCSVMMGANVASEIARGDFAEATIGCCDSSKADLLKKTFDTPDFSVTVTDDVAAVEVSERSERRNKDAQARLV